MKRLIKTFRSYLRIFGIRGMIAIPMAMWAKSTSFPVTFPVRVGADKKRSVTLRLGTSDVVIFESIFLDGEFKFDLQEEPKFIVDAGAYIGISAVYFSIRYPNAKIVAIEPELSNYALLRRNSENFPNIIPMNMALWETETTLSIAHPRKQKWKYRTFASFRTVSGVEEGAQQVSATTIDAILRAHGFPSIDLLKLDIEGAEIEVLGASDSWIRRVETVVAELHDNFRPGCQDAFESATRDFQFSGLQGEKAVRSRHKLEFTAQPG